MRAPALIRILRARPATTAGLFVGVATFLLIGGGLMARTRAVIAWDAACLVFLGGVVLIFRGDHRADMRLAAEAQEEGEWTVFWITVTGIAAGFAAVIGEFSAGKSMPATDQGWQAGLVGVTLLLSWTVTHTVFALRYAHEYYQPVGRDGIAGGLEFPGKEPPDFWDFLYFAMVLGMTFQVSDVEITDRMLRRLATVHGVLAFLFNTVLVALSVNIGASLL